MKQEEFKVGDWVELKDDNSIRFRIDRIIPDGENTLYWSEMGNRFGNYEFYKSEIQKWKPSDGELVIKENSDRLGTYLLFNFSDENKDLIKDGEALFPVEFAMAQKQIDDIKDRMESLAIDVATSFVSYQDEDEVLSFVIKNEINKDEWSTKEIIAAKIEDDASAMEEKLAKEIAKFLVTLSSREFADFTIDYYDEDFSF